MTSAQLKDLEQRCYKAAQKGHLIGKGSALANMLMTECGEVAASPHGHGSPEHLLRVIRAVTDVRSGKLKKLEPRKPEPVKKPEPIKKQTLEDNFDGDASMAAELKLPVSVKEDIEEPEPDKSKKGKSKKGN